MCKIYMIPTIILILLLICGIICITVNLVYLNLPEPKTKIVYRYMPRTFEEEQNSRPIVSEIFKSMFTEHSPWVNSVMEYDTRKQESINKYYVSQI